MADLELIFDIIFIALLVAVLVYAVRLNRHIAMLQNNKAELEKLLAGFVSATERAEGAIQRMKMSTKENSQSMDDKMSKAENLHADLSFLVGRAESIADKLEGDIRASRGSAAAPAAAAPAAERSSPPKLEAGERPAGREADGNDQRAKSKSDLLKALQGMR